MWSPCKNRRLFGMNEKLNGHIPAYRTPTHSVFGTVKDIAFYGNSFTMPKIKCVGCALADI